MMEWCSANFKPKVVVMSHVPFSYLRLVSGAVAQKIPIKELTAILTVALIWAIGGGAIWLYTTVITASGRILI